MTVSLSWVFATANSVNQIFLPYLDREYTLHYFWSITLFHNRSSAIATDVNNDECYGTWTWIKVKIGLIFAFAKNFDFLCGHCLKISEIAQIINA